jgi:hypothetical protein
LRRIEKGGDMTIVIAGNRRHRPPTGHSDGIAPLDAVRPA